VAAMLLVMCVVGGKVIGTTAVRAVRGVDEPNKKEREGRREGLSEC